VNSAKFKPQDEVRARHILIAVKPTATLDEQAKAEAEADDIIKQLKGGADFAKLAEEKSKDPGSKGSGGDLGWQEAGTFVPEFSDAMAKLIGTQPFHGLRYEGRRFDCGDKVGWLEAQIAFALARPDMAGAVRGFLRNYV
jgi:membrane protein involved in colicin uptake